MQSPLATACESYLVHPLPTWRSRPSAQPRLGELFHADSLPIPCGGGSADAVWSGELCASAPLVPRRSPPWQSGSRVRVLMTTSDAPAEPLLVQIERTLLLLRAARAQGMVPAVFLGRHAFSPACAAASRGAANRYYDEAAGDNIWNYYFEPPVPAYAPGSIVRQPARVFVALPASTSDGKSDDDEEEEGGSVGGGSGDVGGPAAAPTRSEPAGRPARERKRRRLARLLRDYVRVRPEVGRAAQRLLVPWRRQASALLGVALGVAPTAERTREAMQGHISTFLRAHGTGTGPGAAVVVVGARPSELAGLRARHGAQRVRARADGEARCVDGRGDASGGDASDGGRCAGFTELIDALLLAHCDYLLTEGHPAAEFAMWWNARLLEAHLDLDARPLGGAAPGQLQTPMLPWARRGRSWQPDASALSHARAMLAALDAMANRTGARAHVHMPQDGSAAVGFVPGLPRPTRQQLLRQQPKSWVTISEGRCAKTPSARIMRRDECEAYANEAKRHFLGSSTDTAEYPGCTLWADTQLVEFNDHADEGQGCNIAPRGSCVCHVG